MHILVTGGTGFIGSALVPELIAGGHSVTILSRKAQSDAGSVSYVTRLQDITTDVEAVVNLAGASLAAKRWGPKYKREMINSRVAFTEGLVDWMLAARRPPQVLLSGSAIGYYGASPSAVFDESAEVGNGFSADLCQRWEAAAEAMTGHGCRVVRLRFGVVFDRDGGALQQMLQSFRFGIGSWVGSGEQWLSWVHRWDVVRAIMALLSDNEAVGPFNLTAPHAVTHRQFAEIAGHQKATLFKIGVPGWVMRTAFGEMADELLLTGQRVVPHALEQRGFSFTFPDLAGALSDILAKSPSRKDC